MQASPTHFAPLTAGGSAQIDPGLIPQVEYPTPLRRSGSQTRTRTVVIKFPTYERALEWYNSEEYKPIKPIRLANSEANGIIIKGV